MSLTFALSPLIVVTLGALLLMLAEAFSKNKEGLAVGTAMVLVAGGAFSGAVWMKGTGGVDVASVARWLPPRAPARPRRVLLAAALHHARGDDPRGGG
jgi:NADH-quinone oxidoreductase subunit N